MKIIFEQTQEDILDFAKSRHNKWGIKRMIALFAITVFVVLLISKIWKGEFSWDDFIITLIPLAVILIVFLVISKLVLKKFINGKNKEHNLGARELDFSDSEIKVKTTLTNTSYAWSSFSRLKQSPKNYFLFLNAFQPIVIPKRAFESETQQMEFEKLVATKIG